MAHSQSKILMSVSSAFAALRRFCFGSPQQLDSTELLQEVGEGSPAVQLVNQVLLGMIRHSESERQFHKHQDPLMVESVKAPYENVLRRLKIMTDTILPVCAPEMMSGHFEVKVGAQVFVFMLTVMPDDEQFTLEVTKQSTVESQGW